MPLARQALALPSTAQTIQPLRGKMTDLENLQKQENEMEAATAERDKEIFEQIFSLYQQLSPIGQGELLAAAMEADLDDDLSEDDDDE